MPAPLGLGAEGHLLFVRLGEGLESGGIDGEGEFAVADGEGRARVDGVERGVVARDEFLARAAIRGLRGQRGGYRAEEGPAGERHGHRVTYGRCASLRSARVRVPPGWTGP